MMIHEGTGGVQEITGNLVPERPCMKRKWRGLIPELGNRELDGENHVTGTEILGRGTQVSLPQHPQKKH
jgi:hypothetical protein